MIILDPHGDGVIVWFGGKVSKIKGHPNECCDEIIERVCKKVNGNYIQEYPISVDCSGIGMSYYDKLRSIGLIIFPIKAISIDAFLPRLNDK